MNFSKIIFQFLTYFYSFLRLFNIKFVTINKNYLRYLSNNTKIKINQNTNFIEGYKVYFLNKTNLELFSGKWYDINNNELGKCYMKIIQDNQNFQKRINHNFQILFKLFEGKYSDSWAIITNIEIKETNININESYINNEFTSIIEFGENLNRPFKTMKCQSNIKLNYEKNQNDKIIKFNGTFTSENCDYQFKFETELLKEEIPFWEVTIYSIISTIISLLTMFNTIWTILKINGSLVYGNSISLMTICINIIWDAYGCLCHFFLFVFYRNYSYQFAIPAFVNFINFSIIDLRLLYVVWSLKNTHLITDPLVLRRKLIQFYLFFYLIMFFCFLFVMKFYFDKIYILIEIVITWIPQIVYNSIYKNKVSFPIIYIILIDLNRIFPSLYFRCYSNNFFQFSPDYLFVIIIFILLFIFSSFLYSQSIFGSRWFLPESFKQKSFDFYKTEKEIKEIKNNIDSLECIICLSPIFQNEDNLNNNNNNNSSEYISINVNDTDEDISIKSGEKVYNNNNNKRKCHWDYFLDFHERSWNISNKPIMITPCQHIFHSNCLEEWLQMKKECPSCRRDLSFDIIN